MKNRIFHQIIVLNFFFCGLHAQETFSLEAAIQYALQHSIDLKMDSLNIRDAEAQLIEYKAIGLPKVNASVSYQYNFEIFAQPTTDFITPAVINVLNENQVTPDPIPFPELQTFNIPFGQRHNLTGGIRADAMLFDGSYIVGLRAQNLFRELIKKQKDQSIYTTRSNVSKAYILVLINKMQRDILNKNIQNLKNTLDQSTEIYKEGLIEKLDIDRLSFSLHTLQSNYENISRIYALSKNLLKFQMNYPPEKDIELSDEIDRLLLMHEVTKDLSSEDIVFDLRPEYRILEQNQQLNQLNIKRHKKAYLPSVFVFANLSRSLQDDDFLFGANQWIPTSAAGLNIQIPIYDARDKKAKIERARIDVAQNQLNIKNFERAMTLQVKNGYINYQNALIDMTNRKENMQLADAIYQTAQTKYREGVGSSLELSQAERDYFAAEQLYIQSLYQLLSTKINLQIALGKI